MANEIVIVQSVRQLSVADRRDRDRLENDIRTGLRFTIPTAMRLVEFLDRELYVETHGSGSAGFIAWGLDVLGIGKTYLYDLVRLGRVTATLSAIPECDTTGLRESHARELADLPKEQQQSVWAEVIAEGEPTAKRVREVRERQTGSPPSSGVADLCRSIQSTGGTLSKKYAQLDTADPACTLSPAWIAWLEAYPG